jgi:DNA-binding Xre family transcriptional regulator
MTLKEPHSARRVGRKTTEDVEANERIRAHLRQQMEERAIDKAELSRRVKINAGNLTRQLAGDRGFSIGQVLRICRALKLTPTRLLEEDPPQRYFLVPGDQGTSPDPAPRRK